MCELSQKKSLRKLEDFRHEGKDEAADTDLIILFSTYYYCLTVLFSVLNEFVLCLLPAELIMKSVF